MNRFRTETIGGLPVRFIGDEEPVIIYCIRPAAGEAPVYVGSTAQRLRHRIRAHVLDAKKGSQVPLHVWLRGRGEGFSVEVLEVVAAGVRHERERAHVSAYANLLNVTDGGPGLSGHAFAGTPHALRIGASVRTSVTFRCEECATPFSRKLSEVVKGNCRFCSRSCYQDWQRGRPRIPEAAHA